MEIGGQEAGREVRRRQRREGRGRDGGGGERGRKEIQANNKRDEMCKYKEQNSEGIAITVIIQLHPEHGGT